MPEMNTIFSRGMPSCGISFCTVARMAKSPQPGHQRTIWSLTKSLRVSIGPEAGSIVKDRKSTRLNSSHQIISYAVFCLKKKKRKKKCPYHVKSDKIMHSRARHSYTLGHD